MMTDDHAVEAGPIDEDVLMLALDWAGVRDADLIAKNAAAEYRRLIALRDRPPEREE
jgi:hypothetical protein